MLGIANRARSYYTLSIMPSATSPSVQQLQRAIKIAEDIDRLEGELAALLGRGSSVQETRSPSTVAARSRRGKRRTMSPEAREKIAAAQRARWARTKRRSSAPAKSTTSKTRK